MNLRVVLFSGLITALIGAMVGIALGHIAQRETRKQAMMVGGATLGFVLGASSSMIMQHKEEHLEDYREIDK